MSSVQVAGAPPVLFAARIDKPSRAIRSWREVAVHCAPLSWRDIGATRCVGAAPDIADWPAPEPPPT